MKVQRQNQQFKHHFLCFPLSSFVFPTNFLSFVTRSAQNRSQLLLKSIQMLTFWLACCNYRHSTFLFCSSTTHNIIKLETIGFCRVVSCFVVVCVCVCVSWSVCKKKETHKWGSDSLVGTTSVKIFFIQLLYCCMYRFIT